ncbi:MAG: flagellar hook capping FlgD N-terminal domain-containing protein [Sulfitobacter sp.]
MNVTTTTSATANAAAIAAASANATSAYENSAVLSSDFETFLKMLTAQARYQDPLEPIDSSEYAAQLAQFSMVEQQVKGNDLLTALTQQLGLSNMGEMAGWIGMEARSTGPAYFGGAPITITPRPLADADTVHLVVYDAQGTEVDRHAIPVAADPVQWAGVKADGTAFDSGAYSFAVESRKAGAVLLDEPAETYSMVTELRQEGSDTLLVLEGGTLISASAVTALRSPG